MRQNELHQSFLSGTGFARRYGEQARAEAIVAAAQNGDPRALAHWRHFIDAFARSLASVINILDPQVIVLGGGLSNVSQDLSRSACRCRRIVLMPLLRVILLRHLPHADQTG